MRIHSLTLENFRGVERLELRDLPETGVIVIHGDNEQGKSTILDALDAVLNEKHGGRSRAVKAWQPAGRDDSPTVTLHATVGPVTFTIRKNWLRAPKAELRITAPQRADYTGREAEDQLEEILSRHMDRELARTLFLRQDDLGDGIAAVGISSVTKALDGADDAESSGTEDTALSAAVEKEYERYFTAGGQERLELKEARVAFESAQTAQETAAAENAELAGHVDRFDRVTERQAQALADLPGAEAEEQELAERARVAAEAEERAGVLRRELQLATEALERAESAVTQRATLAAAVTDAEELLAERRAGLEAAQEEAGREATQLQELGERRTAALQAQKDAAARLRTARRELRLVTDASRRADLTTQLASVRELNERIAQLRTATAGREITAADVDAVEEATTELTLARRLRAGAAARLEFTGPAGETLTVDGTELTLGDEPVSVELSDGTALLIGGITARYRAGHTAETGTDPVAAAEQTLTALLEELDLPDLAAVREAHDVHRRATEDLAALLRERTSLLGGAEEEQLVAELARLEEELADEDLPDLDVDAATRAVEEAEDAGEEAGRLLAEIDEALAPWQQRRAENALTALNVRIEAAEESLRQAQSALDSALAGASDEALGEAVREATRAREEALAQSRAADEEVAAADPQLAADLHEGAVVRLRSLHETVARSREDLAGLRSYIEQAQGAAERLDKAESALEAARHRLDSVTRRAEAVQLLRETLQRHRAEARARYARPFAEQLTLLARPVFGTDVEFTLSDQLEVSQRSDADGTVPLADLSGGAKEQMAILTRFAIAHLTSRESEDGQVPVPVIIDDALGSTDPTRLQRMSTLFSRMGDTGQVIVLTCVPQRYERVGGRTEYAIEDLKSSTTLL